MLLTRWSNLMVRMGFPENRETYDRLVQHYSDKNRAYHNLKHIEECLALLDAFAPKGLNVDVIEMAIWFHDIIYNPYGKENEKKSAIKAQQFLEENSADNDLIEEVYQLIMSTLHKDTPKNQNEELIMDIDIAILGKDESAYQSYTEKIRKEYKLVPWPLYKKKRKEILMNFLNRDYIYQTPYFRDKFEKKARLNIQKEIEQL